MRTDAATRILRERARALAERVDSGAVEHGEELAVWRVADRAIGCAMASVRRVEEILHLTEVPGAPPHILGLIGVEGRLISVVDLARLYGLGRSELADIGHAVIVGHGARELAIAADRLSGIEGFDPARVYAVPDAAAGALSQSVPTATGEVLILDIAALIADPKLHGGGRDG